MEGGAEKSRVMVWKPSLMSMVSMNMRSPGLVLRICLCKLENESIKRVKRESYGMNFSRRM